MKTKMIRLSLLDNVTQFDQVITLNIGPKNIATRYFKHDIPSPYEVEMAIIEIEDTIEAIAHTWHRYVANCTVNLVASKTQFADLIAISKIDNTLIVSQLEYTFNRLADVIAGSPKRLNELKIDAQFISLVLILRELMHHLSIEAIHFV